MVTITRVNLKRCKFHSDNDREMSSCKKALSIFSDTAQYSEKFNEFDENGKRKWDGIHRFYDSRNFFDFGLLDELQHHLNKKGVKWSYKEYYKQDFPKVEIDKRMRPYGKKAIKKFFKRGLGIFKVPPRGGKTYIASELFRIGAELYDEKHNFLFVVDTEDLFRQAVKDISSYLGISEDEMGKINAKKHDFKRFNVAMSPTMVSTFYGRGKNTVKIRNLNKFLASVVLLAVDEVHENSSDKKLNVYRKCKNIKNLAGLSGTPFKQFSLKENLKVKGFYGGICYTIPKKELQDAGYLCMDKVFLVHIDHKSNRRFKCENYQDFLTKYIYTNEYRNGVLFEIIKICQFYKWKTLILFNSVKHGNLVSKETDLPFISGEDNATVRQTETNKFLRGKGNILLASNIFKKGITLPEAEVVLIADGGYEASVLTQKYSRVLGVTETKKTAAILDMMDSGVDYFREHSSNRLEVYNEEMPNRIEVYNDFEISSMGESIDEWLNEK